MKKLIVLSLVFAMTMAMSGATAQATTGITTGLTQDTTGGAAPFVKVKWEANPDRYTDDDMDVAGAQFYPSGKYDVVKTIAICAIVSDPDGVADIGNVYADVFYPENIELGPSHVALPSQSGDGCGELMQEDELTVLTKSAGIELFCDKVKNQNNDLPTFNSPYTYTEICKADGELQKETAKVYCVEKDLSYEDPDGEYEVWAVAQDKVGLQGKLVNHFDYLPMTAFETDFNSITYGNVRLNTEKIVNGDLTWDSPLNSGLASIRNVGNTRAAISVEQDDMNFSQTSGAWNVYYKARIGNDELDWAQYDPEEVQLLADELDLSELDEIDFSIFVKKFPPTNENGYFGTMTLTADPVEHITCGPTHE